MKAIIKVEPYWNVNTVWGQFILHLPIIKVEPYWNVNFITVDDYLNYKNN